MMQPYSKKHIHLAFILLWMLIATVLIIKSGLMQYHVSDEVDYSDLFDLSFYYFIPAFVWSILTPAIISFTEYKSLISAEWKKNLLIHLLLSIAISPLTRVASIFIDFALKNLLGMIDAPVWEIVMSVKLVAIASSPNSFVFYWLIVGVYSFYEYYRIKSESVSNQRSSTSNLLTFTENGKKHILEASEISHVEASRNNVIVHHHKKILKIRKTMQMILKELDPHVFYQVHRSFIVNIHEIEFLKHWRRGEYLIQLKGGTTITSSRSFKSNIDTILSNK